jgi:Fe-S cluster assembly iron-binding protein IscA
MNATPQAIEALKNVFKAEVNPQSGVRIFTQQGCCGPALQMSVVEKPSTGDLQLSIESVKFFIEEPAVDMLAGVTIDYDSKGFRLNGMKRNGGRCCG